MINVENLTLYIKMNHYEIVIGLCVLLITYIISTAFKKVRLNFPPRVMGLPFVGYLPFLTKDLYLDFMQLGKKYGDIFSIKLGSQDIVILHGVDAITETLNKFDFVGRPPNSALQKVFPSSAFFGTDSLLWKEQRKAVFQFMKHIGFGKSQIEGKLVEEINYFMGILRNSESQPMDIRMLVCSSTINNILSLIIGKRFEYNDPQLQFLEKNREEFLKSFTQYSLDVFLPWMRYIPFARKYQVLHKSKNVIENDDNFFLKEINEHSKTLNPAHIRDFIDRYLIEIDNQKSKNTDTSFNKKMLIKNCVDLYLLGSESIESTLLWFVYIVAAFPDVQKKVQREIMEVIGSDRIPEFTDMRNMPYTHALMLEIMRWKCVAPISLVRCASKDTTVCGYNIPKGTTVMANIWASQHDSRYWNEPEKFKPERFLSKDGLSVVKPRCFMPFLVGKRACPGESMANLELFLYITIILRAFEITFPDKTKPTFKGNFSTVYRPEPYLVRFLAKK